MTARLQCRHCGGAIPDTQPGARWYDGAWFCGEQCLDACLLVQWRVEQQRAAWRLRVQRRRDRLSQQRSVTHA